jgi:hypothetical protein
MDPHPSRPGSPEAPAGKAVEGGHDRCHMAALRGGARALVAGRSYVCFGRLAPRAREIKPRRKAGPSGYCWAARAGVGCCLGTFCPERLGFQKDGPDSPARRSSARESCAKPSRRSWWRMSSDTAGSLALTRSARSRACEASGPTSWIFGSNWLSHRAVDRRSRSNY